MNERPDDQTTTDTEPAPEPEPTPADLVPADASPFDMPSGSGVEGTEMRHRPHPGERRPPRRA